MPPEPAPSRWTVPAAIVVAAALISGAIVYDGRMRAQSPAAAALPGEVKNVSIPPVTSEDHIRGNPDAPIVLVEYSDFECPFCKQFHQTLQQIVNEYGKSGKVAWVYRHFPLVQIHPKAVKEAEASECAAAQGGNDAFWRFADRIFAVTEGNNTLDPARLPQIANEIGLDVARFTACLENGTYAAKVQRQYEEATAAGGTGTPLTVLVVGDTKFPIEGALPYAQIRAAIENVLAEPNVGVVPTENPTGMGQ